MFSYLDVKASVHLTSTETRSGYDNAKSLSWVWLIRIEPFWDKQRDEKLFGELAKPTSVKTDECERNFFTTHLGTKISFLNRAVPGLSHMLKLLYFPSSHINHSALKLLLWLLLENSRRVERKREIICEIRKNDK